MDYSSTLVHPLFPCIDPDSTSAKIQEAINATKEQAKATTDAITAEIKKQKDVPQKVEVTIKDDKK